MLENYIFAKQLIFSIIHLYKYKEQRWKGERAR